MPTTLQCITVLHSAGPSAVSILLLLVLTASFIDRFITETVNCPLTSYSLAHIASHHLLLSSSGFAAVSYAIADTILYAGPRKLCCCHSLLVIGYNADLTLGQNK